MRENRYATGLKARLYDRFPGCVILKNDSSDCQGIPDFVIFFGPRWAMLEVKASAHAVEQPNQAYWVQTLDAMSFAAFIFPENEEQVLNELQLAFDPEW